MKIKKTISALHSEAEEPRTAPSFRATQLKPEVTQSSEWVPLRQNRLPDGTKLQGIFKNKHSEQ